MNIYRPVLALVAYVWWVTIITSWLGISSSLFTGCIDTITVTIWYMTGISLPTLVTLALPAGCIACSMIHTVVWPTWASINITLVTYKLVKGRNKVFTVKISVLNIRLCITGLRLHLYFFNEKHKIETFYLEVVVRSSNLDVCKSFQYV